jgi:hypothetical protein
MLESKIKSSCRNQLEKWGWLVVHIIQCNKNGWPDTQIFRKGVTYFIEFKQPGKHPEPLQLYRHQKLKEQGFTTLVVTDLKQLESLR